MLLLTMLAIMKVASGENQGVSSVEQSPALTSDEIVARFQARFAALEDRIVHLNEKNRKQENRIVLLEEELSKLSVDKDLSTKNQAINDAAKERRRMTGVKSTASMIYNGDTFVLSKPLHILGSLNVTGIVTDSSPAAVDTTPGAHGFKAEIGASFALQSATSQRFGDGTNGVWTVDTTTEFDTYGVAGAGLATTGTDVGKFIAPVDGQYYGAAHFYIQFGSETDSVAINIYKNSAEWFKGGSSGASVDTSSCTSCMFLQNVAMSGLIYMNAGDTLWVGYNSWSTTMTVYAGYFSVFLVNES